MKRQKFTGLQSGLSFRRLKKLLKRKEQQASDYRDKVNCVAGCYVKIEFSREIAYWDDRGYYENPKFDQWWAHFSERAEENHDRYGYLHVAYSNPKTLKEEYRSGMFHTNLVRWLIIGGGAQIIRPKMSFFHFAPPAPFQTRPGCTLYALKNAMEDCAKFCGGTVEFSYSDVSRIPVSEEIYNTMILPETNK